MKYPKKYTTFLNRSDRLIYLSAIVLSIFGFAMIISAEMGEASADLSIISKSSSRQIAYLLLGIICLFLFSLDFTIKKLKKTVFAGYLVVLILLVATRFFEPVGGAYGWIRIGGLSFQPSELAKLYTILLAANMFSNDLNIDHKKNFWRYVELIAIYVAIIFILQNDLGSALVVAAIAYVCILISPIKKIQHYQNRMIIGLILILVAFVLVLTPIGTKALEHIDGSYQIRRFLASADPFAYEYDSGYHLIMSLVSFATGGLFGLGYGKSIHKFMNFPNPSTDFILPVIVEEMGVVFGLLPILLFYFIILIKLIYHSIKDPYSSGKIIFVGTFMYFVCHFVLNVGGVSGLIPLTGVPLLLISSGGTSLVCCLIALGICENEIMRYKEYLKNQNENNSRQI